MNLYQALAEIVADPSEITLGFLIPQPTPPRQCEQCRRHVDVRVSTGIRTVCLDCAVELTT